MEEKTIIIDASAVDSAGLRRPRHTVRGTRYPRRSSAAGATNYRPKGATHAPTNPFFVRTARAREFARRWDFLRGFLYERFIQTVQRSAPYDKYE